MLELTQPVLDARDWGLTEEEKQALDDAGEWFAAGFLDGIDISIPMRHARAIANYLAHCPLISYDGARLYPTGADIWKQADPAILWHMYVTLDYGWNLSRAEELGASTNNPDLRSACEKAQRAAAAIPPAGGWTHSIINFGRVLGEGLDTTYKRICARLATTRDTEKGELYHALLVVVEAIDGYRGRLADYLASLTFDNPGKERNRQRLLAAYADRVPMRPARTFFAAMLATVFLYQLDGNDDIGRIDQFLLPYYQADADPEALDLLRELWAHVDACSGWNVTLAGSTRAGDEAANALTLLCLQAAQHRRRPNLAIRLREDTPDAVWKATIDTLATGTGLPALYSEENYLRAIDLAQLNLPDDDKHDFAFGGCTELMIQGCSNVGSLDGDFSVIKTLEDSLARHLPTAATFEDLLTAIEADLRTGIAELTATINRWQETRATYQPQLMRTLLIDDCIDRGRNFSNGGARHNWSIINIVGLSNAIDSLIAVKQAVYEAGVCTPQVLLAALQANFVGYEELRQYLQGCQHFGNDDAEVNALAARLSGTVFTEFKRYTPWRGGKFLCGTLMFVTYGMFGQPVGATPDGRLAGTPVADSAGPVQGRDRNGPTAMLRAVASLQQLHAPGTLVVNLRLGKELFTTQEGRAKLKSLIRGYFAMGGMQLQVNVVDQAVLRDAIAHPERHGDLVVRMGGYSEYFNQLSDDLKLSILERTEHH